MAWSVDDIKRYLDAKFVKQKPLDISLPLSEIEVVKRSIFTLNKWGASIKTLKDIPQLYYLLSYGDDEYSYKLLSITGDDMLQSARYTLATLRGDCEDIHRLFQAAAIALGERPDNVPLLIVLFGDEEKLTGGHATLLIKSRGGVANIDYTNYVTSGNINGILKYQSDNYSHVAAYALLYPDLSEDPYTYHIEVFKARPEGEYSVQVVPTSEAIQRIAYHLKRPSERKQIKWQYLALAAGALLLWEVIS